jgi:hypothetical protein
MLIQIYHFWSIFWSVYKQQEKQLQGGCPGHQAGQAHHQRPQQDHEVPGAQDENLRTTMRKMVSEDVPDSWKMPLHLPAWLRPYPQQKEVARLALGEPYRGVWEGDLASQLPWLQPFVLYYIGRLWIKGQFKASKRNREPTPKDQGGDGVLREEHHGEGLQEV